MAVYASRRELQIFHRERFNDRRQRSLSALRADRDRRRSPRRHREGRNRQAQHQSQTPRRRSHQIFWGNTTVRRHGNFSAGVPAGCRGTGRRASRPRGRVARLPRRCDVNTSSVSMRYPHRGVPRYHRGVKSREILWRSGGPAMRATITANGGAERYWHNSIDGTRLVLCRNGKLLLQARRSAPWHFTRLRLPDVAAEPAWRTDTRAAASAGVTWTSRRARRAG